jgi:hypothetical protein
MEDHRQTCLWIPEGFLQRHNWEGEDLLQQIAQVTKCRSIITKPALNNRVWSGNTPHLLKQKNLSPRPLQVNWCCSCFGTVMSDTGILPWARHHCSCCIIQWNTDITDEAIESQQAQSFAAQGGYFSLQLSMSTFCSSHCWSHQAAEIWTASKPPT